MVVLAVREFAQFEHVTEEGDMFTDFWTEECLDFEGFEEVFLDMPFWRMMINGLGPI